MQFPFLKKQSLEVLPQNYYSESIFINGASDFQTGHLAMETLLSLTSKRAGDWFKEELRLLGGLDHIVDKGMIYYTYNIFLFKTRIFCSYISKNNCISLKRSLPFSSIFKIF